MGEIDWAAIMTNRSSASDVPDVNLWNQLQRMLERDLFQNKGTSSPTQRIHVIQGYRNINSNIAIQSEVDFETNVGRIVFHTMSN